MNRFVYPLTAFFALTAAAFLWRYQGFRFALAFLFGAAVSAGNVFFFSYLTQSISPEGGNKKPWHAGAFGSRYILMFAGGYVIVKALGVNPLPVLLGMFASTAAVVTSIIIELFERR